MNISWSHSALKQYETCPRQYHEIRVLKRYPRIPTEQTIYGEQLHEAAELYVKDGTALPPQFAFIKGVLDALMSKPGAKLPEVQMALTEALQPCDWDSPYAWVRGVADLAIIDGTDAWVVDYKSGSNKYPDKDQLDLMSLMIFVLYPQVNVVRSALLFLLKNDMIKHKVTREQSDTLWWKYRERVAKIESSLAHGVWNPKQSGLCKRHCVVDTCEFCGGR